MKLALTMLFEGAVLNQRYEITKLVAKGGQCLVYLAQDLRDNRRNRIVKEMRNLYCDPTQQKKMIALFQREAEILMRYDHLHLPEVFELIEDEESCYIVEEYIEGKSLEELLKARTAPLDHEEVAGIAWQLLSLLEFLHTLDPPILLRDIKPGNMLETKEGLLYFVDLTSARYWGPGQGDTVLIGSPGYAPPEQYSGNSDPRSDIYALGATMYRLATRYDPAKTPFLLPAPRSLNPAIPPPMQRVILTALQMKPEDRYCSARAMKEALKEAYPLLTREGERRAGGKKSILLKARVWMWALGTGGLAALLALIWTLVQYLKLQ